MITVSAEKISGKNHKPYIYYPCAAEQFVPICKSFEDGINPLTLTTLNYIV